MNLPTCGDFLSLKSGSGAAALDAALTAGARIVALDTVDDASLAAAGRLIWEERGDRLFVIGSQGVEYALVAYWREAGLIPAIPPAFAAGPVDRIAIVSGSCSPETAAQIAHAEHHGFMPVQTDATLAVDEAAWTGEIERTASAALEVLGQGYDPLVFTATGPDDPAIASVNAAIDASSADRATVNARLGKGLGQMLDRILRQSDLNRCVIAGGDTSGHGAPALGIHALTALAPTVPGAALFKAHTNVEEYADLEIALKGGQMGTPDYFSQIKRGGGTAP